MNKNSVIKEEGEEAEDEDEKGSRSRSDSRDGHSDPEVGANDPSHAVTTPLSVRQADQVGYSRLDHQAEDADFDDHEATSSCSSDLSFGPSSSGNFVYHFQSFFHLYT